MLTNAEFKAFIQKHETEILKNDWTTIYSDLLSFKDIPSLTNFLLNKAHINPLYYMTSIPIYFAYNLDIPSINIPNNVTSIGSFAFNGCTGLTFVTIPSSVKRIGYAAFCGCSGLTTINMSVGVTSIGESAFSGCSSLISITIPNSVTKIGYSAFKNCTSLTSITIPSSVTSIEMQAFADCDNLKEIKYTGTESEGNALLSNVNYLLKFIQQHKTKVIFI